MYPKVRDALLSGEKVTIKYSNIELNQRQPLSNKASDDVMLTSVVDSKMDKIITELSGIKQTISKHNII